MVYVRLSTPLTRRYCSDIVYLDFQIYFQNFRKVWLAWAHSTKSSSYPWISVLLWRPKKRDDEEDIKCSLRNLEQSGEGILNQASYLKNNHGRVLPDAGQNNENVHEDQELAARVRHNIGLLFLWNLLLPNKFFRFHHHQPPNLQKLQRIQKIFWSSDLHSPEQSLRKENIRSIQELRNALNDQTCLGRGKDHPGLINFLYDIHILIIYFLTLKT